MYKRGKEERSQERNQFYDSSLRQRGSPALQGRVRAALDSLMADEGSRPLATHLQQAWDSDSIDGQLKVKREIDLLLSFFWFL